MAEHTQEQQVTDPGCCGIRWVDEDGCCVHCGRDFFDEDTGEERGDGSRVANARLVAAAPEMLAALEGLVGTTLCPQGVCKEGCEAAYAAIAKAKGE